MSQKPANGKVSRTKLSSLPSDVYNKFLRHNRLASHPRAIGEELRIDVEHQVRDCLGNSIKQSPQEIKQRYYPMPRVGAIESAKRFCQTLDEVQQFLRRRERMTELVSRSNQRECFIKRVNEFQDLFQAI